MPSSANTLLKAGLAGSLLLFLLGSTVVAQSASTDGSGLPASEDDQIVKLNRYEVEGYRTSLDNSLEDKRSASQVTDSITAEQIGQFGDQNVGEAIQRIAGVSLTRNNGEGQFISVRGMAPEFTRVEVDGRSTFMTSDQSDPGRAVLLSVFASDLYRTIEVVKSPTAADVEGGAGGTVRLRTPDPLDIGRRRFGFAAGYTDGELRDHLEPQYNVYFSDVFADKRLGILLSATYSKADRRLDKVQMGDNVWEKISSSDPALDGGRYASLLRLEGRRGDIPKINVNAKIQFQATPELQLYTNALLTRERRHEEKSRIQVSFANGKLVSGTVDPDTGTLTSGEFTGQRVDYNDFVREAHVGTTGVTGGAIWTPGEWRVEAKASYSNGIEDFDEYRIQSRVNKDGAGGYDLGDDPRTPALYTASTSLDPSKISLRNLDDNKRITDISEREVQADATRRISQGVISAVRFGLRAADTEFKRRQGGPPAADVTGLSMADGASPFVLDGTFGFGRGGSDFLTQWPEANAKSMYFDHATGGAVVFDNGNYYTIHEKNQAAYLMLEFNHQLGLSAVRGNLGLRVAQTDFKGDGRVTLTAPTQTYVLDDTPSLNASYTEPLPAFNIVWQPRPNSDLLVRGAITRAMTRPTVSQINPSRSIDAVDNTVSRGNPDLKPFLAWQYDLGVEYYFGQNHEGLLGFSGFVKKVDNFIVPDVTTETLAFPDQGLAAEQYTVETFRNGGKASVNGFEVNFQTPFTFLPAPFDSFGVAANYTYTDSSFTDAFGYSFTFPGASKNTYNLILYYEKGGFSTRLAYNYRSDYLDTPSSATDGANTRYGQGQGRLDFSLRYRFQNGIRVSFDVLNLTREQSYIFYDFAQRYQDFTFEGRIFDFAIGYDF